MKVDTNIVNAIESYLAENKIDYMNFAELIGVSAASVTRWRKAGSGITKMRWQSVFNLIRKYLPNNCIYIDDAGREQYLSITSKPASQVYEPKNIPIMVPTFSLEQLSEYDNLHESMTRFGTRIGAATSEYRPKLPDKSGVMIVLLTDDSLAPVLPRGTKLFVGTGERPEDGNLVIAKLASAGLIVGRYLRGDDDFQINGINNELMIFGAVKEARNSITWIFPVLYYEVETF